MTPELLKAVEEGMTRCSYFMHDEAPGSGMQLPGRAELGADLAKIQEFQRQTKS